MTMISQRPPWIVNEETIRTNVFMRPHMNGIHVDISKYPALYTAPRLENLSVKLSCYEWDSESQMSCTIMMKEITVFFELRINYSH